MPAAAGTEWRIDAPVLGSHLESANGGKPMQYRCWIKLEDAAHAGSQRTRKYRVRQQVKSILLKRLQFMERNLQQRRQRGNVQALGLPGLTKQRTCSILLTRRARVQLSTQINHCRARLRMLHGFILTH